MTNPKPTRIKAASINLTRDEAEACLANIGTAQRRVIGIEAAMNDEIAAIKSRYEAQAAPHNQNITRSFHDLHLWAEANRDSLCAGKIKTVRMATGEILWRKRPPSVRITGAPAVIERLISFGLTAFVREKQEIDKDAILAEPDQVKGIKGIKVITDVEDFVAKPFETEIERVEPVLRSAA